MAAVGFQHVVKTYRGPIAALEDFSLEVADGELLVLVGPSGCGKTTALRLVAGLETPTRGSLHLGGRRVDGVPPQRRNVAMVFQSDTLYPHLSVYDNLAFALRMRGTARREIRQRVAQAAATLGIDDLLARRPWELSGGQRRRVALGRAITGRPAVFLLDEPLSGLDAGLRVQIRREIRRLHEQRGATMIHVTHDQAEAMTLGDRIAVLRAGRLQQVAAPAALYRRPANRFVAALVGSPPMNFCPGRIEAGDGRFAFRGESLLLEVSPAHQAALAPYRGRTVLLGIRPEHLRRAAGEPAADHPPVRARVQSRELLGAECHVEIRLGNAEWIVRTGDADEFRPGEEVELTLSAEHLHFFDPATEEAILK
jgi:multiple sugar transport system ATP-binding protein